MPHTTRKPTDQAMTPDQGALPDGGARQFRPDTVPRELITAVLDLARRAPSGTNTQPWNVYVLQGASRDALVGLARTALSELTADGPTQAGFWDRYRRLPGSQSWPARDWAQGAGGFLACADAAFGSGSFKHVRDLDAYFGLHGAPVALVCTIDCAMGLGSMLDYGMFLQNIASAAAGRALATELQTGWRGLADTVLAHIGAPEGSIVVAVMALGYTPAQASAAPDGPSHAQQAQTAVVWHD